MYYKQIRDVRMHYSMGAYQYSKLPIYSKGWPQSKCLKGVIEPCNPIICKYLVNLRHSLYSSTNMKTWGMGDPNWKLITIIFDDHRNQAFPNW